MLEIEKLVMAHRYLYYVLMSPVISDREYDLLELDAYEKAPSDSPVHELGSSLPENYSQEIIDLANELLNKKQIRK